MTHSRKTEEALEALSRLRENPDLPAVHGEVSHYLAHKSNAVVAKAAKLAAGFELHDARIRGRAESLVGQRNSKVLQRYLASEFQP